MATIHPPQVAAPREQTRFIFVMALVMAASLGPSLENTIIAISIPLIPNVARVIRSSTLAIRELPYVEAARAAR